MTTALLVCIVATLLAQEKQTEPEALAYPTFEPFLASRMFMMFGDPKTADLEKLSKELAIIAQASAAGKKAGEEFAPPNPSRISAFLEPEIPDGQRVVASLVPLVLMRLEALWSTSKWTSDHVALAHTATGVLKQIPDAPQPTFVEGENARNRAGLEELVRWFRAKVSRPEWYAAMIFTMDDGPYIGIPFESTRPLAAESVQRLDEKTELRLCRVERENEPWVLQVIGDGKPLWARVLSAAPDESVSEVSFLDDPVQALGPYGWKVRLVVSWSGGRELSEVFLDPKGNLLFYFLSW